MQPGSRPMLRRLLPREAEKSRNSRVRRPNCCQFVPRGKKKENNVNIHFEPKKKGGQGGEQGGGPVFFFFKGNEGEGHT